MKYAVFALSVLFASAAFAAPKTYQVTGPVLEVKGDAVVVQKGDEKWEVAVDAADLKTLKAGDKVTIEYTMNAKKVTKR
jgi:hypothetical protein